MLTAKHAKETLYGQISEKGKYTICLACGGAFTCVVINLAQFEKVKNSAF